MGLKGANPYFQSSRASKVFTGLIYRIYELYIDDVFIQATTESHFLINLRKLFQRLREHNVSCYLTCGKYRSNGKLEWTPETIHSVELYQTAKNAVSRRTLQLRLPKRARPTTVSAVTRSWLRTAR